MTFLSNVNDRKLFLTDPKSGRQSEIVFIPIKVADRLREYIATENIKDEDSVFPLGYTRTREIVKNAGNKIRCDFYPCCNVLAGVGDRGLENQINKGQMGAVF